VGFAWGGKIFTVRVMSCVFEDGWVKNTKIRMMHEELNLRRSGAIIYNNLSLGEMMEMNVVSVLQACSQGPEMSVLCVKMT